jgi:hypothetical protein
MAVQALEFFAEANQQIAEALTQPADPDRTDLPEEISRLIQTVGETVLAKVKAVLKLLRICSISVPQGR